MITISHLSSSPSSSFTFSNLHFSYRSHLILILISLLFPMTPFVLLYIMNFSLFFSLSSFLLPPFPPLFSSNPCARTTLMSCNILSGGTLSQTYHFYLISIRKIISLLVCLTAVNGFCYHKRNFECWDRLPKNEKKRQKKKKKRLYISSVYIFM